MDGRKKVRISWIDDDADVLEPVTRLLDRERFEILIYFTYAEAQAAMEEICNSDLIFLDLILPAGRGANLPPENNLGNESHLGLTLLDELHSRGCQAPVIVFSILAYSPDLPLKEDLARLGVVDQISKPVRPSELREKVEERFLPEG